MGKQKSTKQSKKSNPPVTDQGRVLAHNVCDLLNCVSGLIKDALIYHPALSARQQLNLQRVLDLLNDLYQDMAKQLAAPSTCPWCGSVKEPFTYGERSEEFIKTGVVVDHGIKWMSACHECSASGPACGTRQEAIDAWLGRKPPAKLKAIDEY